MSASRLPRRKPLAPGQPLARTAMPSRRTPLPRGSSQLARSQLPAEAQPPRTRVRPVSKKRQRENRERAELIRQLWPVRPMCVRPGCPRLADDVHEILTRARGGSITDAANFAPLCRKCHDEVTNEAPWAYETGLLVHSWGAA